MRRRRAPDGVARHLLPQQGYQDVHHSGRGGAAQRRQEFHHQQLEQVQGLQRWQHTGGHKVSCLCFLHLKNRSRLNWKKYVQIQRENTGRLCPRVGVGPSRIISCKNFEFLVIAGQASYNISYHR